MTEIASFNKTRVWLIREDEVSGNMHNDGVQIGFAERFQG